MQSYCGQGERQVSLALSVGGLDGSLPQIFPFLQNLGIPSALSDLTLALSPFTSAVRPARKTVFPTTRLKGASQEGKELKPPNLKDYASKKMTIEQGRRVGIDRFPNFHRTGSVRGMKRLYYGSRCLLVRCGDYIYNVSPEPWIYYQATI